MEKPEYREFSEILRIFDDFLRKLEISTICLDLLWVQKLLHFRDYKSKLHDMEV